MRGCRREQEIAEAMRAGHWPVACDEELRSHVRECRRCADFVRVKMALAGMRAGDLGRARLEAPGLVMWRAQMRRRNAALERVARPMQQAYVFAVGVLVAVLVGLGVMAVRQGADWTAGSFVQVWRDAGTLVVWGMVGAIALVGAVMVYVAAERE
jgi:hypothetical protein